MAASFSLSSSALSSVPWQTALRKRRHASLGNAATTTTTTTTTAATTNNAATLGSGCRGSIRGTLFSGSLFAGSASTFAQQHSSTCVSMTNLLRLARVLGLPTYGNIGPTYRHAFLCVARQWAHPPRRLPSSSASSASPEPPLTPVEVAAWANAPQSRWNTNNHVPWSLMDPTCDSVLDDKDNKNDTQYEEPVVKKQRTLSDTTDAEDAEDSDGDVKDASVVSWGVAVPCWFASILFPDHITPSQMRAADTCVDAMHTSCNMTRAPPAPGPTSSLPRVGWEAVCMWAGWVAQFPFRTAAPQSIPPNAPRRFRWLIRCASQVTVLEHAWMMHTYDSRGRLNGYTVYLTPDGSAVRALSLWDGGLLQWVWTGMWSLPLPLHEDDDKNDDDDDNSKNESGHYDMPDDVWNTGTLLQLVHGGLHGFGAADTGRAVLPASSAGNSVLPLALVALHGMCRWSHNTRWFEAGHEEVTPAQRDVEEMQWPGEVLPHALQTVMSLLQRINLKAVTGSSLHVQAFQKWRQQRQTRQQRLHRQLSEASEVSADS